MNALAQTQPQKMMESPSVSFTGSSLLDPGRFEHMVRVGRMLGMSPLVPRHLRDGGADAATANGVLILNMAERLREDPLTVAQNIYFVSGRPGWNTTYVIAKANQHGVFKDPIDWEVKGSGDSLSVTAFGVLAKTNKKVKVTCDMAMAKAEGWTKNSKYQSMPEQMLRYRSAAFLIRLYCPEVMIGVPAQVELELDRDFKDVTPAEDVTKPAQDAGIMAALSEAPAERAPAKKVDRTPPKPAEREPEPEQVTEDELDLTPAEKIDPETGEVLSENPADAEQAAEPSDTHKITYSQVTEDIARGAPVEPTLNFHAEKLAEMKAEAPDLHQKLMQEIGAA